MARAERNWSLTEDYGAGFLHKRDVTQMPPGALILGSQNVQINDNDRISVRTGSELLGAVGASADGVRSLHAYKKRSGLNILIRTHGTVVEFYHPGTEAWENLNSGYTSSQRFGFRDHNVNTDAMDYTYFCNAVEPYSRWGGAYSQLNGALAGSETEIVVDSTLTADIFNTGTAASVTTTTLTVSAGWAANLWNTLYVRITSGAQSGKVSLISATTSTTITFATITGLSGTPTYEIRQAAFKPSGTLRIGTTNVAYTSIDQDNRFAGASSTPVALDNASIAQAIEEIVDGARGNILLVKDTRMFVAGVKKSPSSVYYSTIANAASFAFSVPRSAEEGGVIDTPEGGGAVTGLGIQEDFIYLIKEDIVKTLGFTQDANDLPIIDTLIEASGVGANVSSGVFKIDNMLYMSTSAGAVKAIGRIANIDFVQPMQLSDPIVNFVKNLDFSDAQGIYHKQKAYIAARTGGASYNNIVIVYNTQVGAWEAPITGWNVGAFAVYNNQLHYGDSLSNTVYNTEVATHDDNGNAYNAVARLAYMNYGRPELQKEFHTLFLEGYIGPNTTIDITLRYNYLGGQEIKGMQLSGTDTNYIVSSFSLNTLGINPLGLEILGAEEVVEEPNDLPKFRVYFPLPITPFYEMSVEVASNEIGAQWEILRHSFDVELTQNSATKLKKSLS